MITDAASPRPGPSRPKAFVALYHSIDAEDWNRKYDEGVNVEESPYGFHRAAEFGFDVMFAKDAPRPSKGGTAAFVTRLLGFDIVHAWTNRKRVAEADVVWTMTEGEGFAIALLFALRLVSRKPVICNVVWMLNSWDRARAYKKLIYRLLAHDIAVLSVHSEPCLTVARRAFPGLRSELMYFGVDANLLARAPLRTVPVGEPLHVVSLGSDKTRDWTTLFAAFGNDPRFRLTVVCWRLSEADVAAYSNVSILRIRSRADFVGCYHAADLAVVPMTENIFSGITSALDAASVGVPVICSRTGGVSTYFNDDEVCFVPVGDPAAMREAAAASTDAGRREWADRAHRRFLDRDYSTRRLAQRYCDVSRALLMDSSASQPGPHPVVPPSGSADCPGYVSK